jgi:hypothetical protein
MDVVPAALGIGGTPDDKMGGGFGLGIGGGTASELSIFTGAPQLGHAVADVLTS